MFKGTYRIAKKYFGLGADNKKLLMLLSVTAAFNRILVLTLPFIASMIVRHATNREFDTALIWTAIFALTSAFYVLVRHINNVFYAKCTVYTHNSLQVKLLNKVSQLDENFTKDISTAYIVNSSFDDIDKARQIPDLLFDSIALFANMIIAIIVIFTVDIYVGIIALVFNAITVFVYNRNIKKSMEYTAKQRAIQDQITGLIGQVIDGSKEINAFDMKNDLHAYLESYKASFSKAYFTKRKHNDRISCVNPLIIGVGKILIYLLLAILVLSGHYDIAMLVMVVGYYENTERVSDDIFTNLKHITVYSTQVDRLHRILSYKTKHMMHFGDNSADDIDGSIKFVDVSFAYEKQTMLKNVNLTIKPNTLTTIVGKSGNGKSTIFRLLLRLYRPNQGTILLNGVNIFDYSQGVYPNNVSIVTQKPFIFDMSIRANLDMIDPDRERQIAACKRVGIHNRIASLPDGYDTLLLRDADILSAGEKQLLAFARTLLSKAEVLLFDEVTSTLDLDTSRQMFRVMQDLKKDHTVLVITHNPELMRLSSDIIVVHGGRIVGQGGHATLIRRCKWYKELQA